MTVERPVSYGRYQINGKLILKEYVLQPVGSNKHLRPKFTEHESVLKSAYQFNRDP